MKDLLGRIKKAKALEACHLVVMPTTSFAVAKFSAKQMPEIWRMAGTCSVGAVSIYVLDAVVLTLARESCEGRPKPLRFRGHWLELEPTQPRQLAFYAVSIVRVRRSG
jgi:hypothetical protein